MGIGGDTQPWPGGRDCVIIKVTSRSTKLIIDNNHESEADEVIRFEGFLPFLCRRIRRHRNPLQSLSRLYSLSNITITLVDTLVFPREQLGRL